MTKQTIKSYDPQSDIQFTWTIYWETINVHCNQ